MAVALILAAQFVNAEAIFNIAEAETAPTNLSKDCAYILKKAASQTNLDHFVKVAVSSCEEAPNAGALQLAVEQAKLSQSASQRYELMKRLAARRIIFSEMARNGIELKDIKTHSGSTFADNGDGAGQYDFNEMTKILGIDRLDYRTFHKALYMQEPDRQEYEYLQYNHLSVVVSLTIYLYETVFP